MPSTAERTTATAPDAARDGRRANPDHIQGVLDRLDEIIAWARETGSPAGYFAALYRQVTAQVAEGIEQGYFEDGPRMERLDAVFAGRYLEAFDAFQRGAPMTRSWAVAFERTEQWRPIVLQHLVGGMNAHINLDLGIATATVAPGGELAGLHVDFLRINKVLSSLLQQTKDALASIWPPLRLIDWLSGPAEDAFADFSLGAARDGAWRFAELLAALPQSEWPAHIAKRDGIIGGPVAGLVYRPGFWLSQVALVVRAAERGSVASKVDTLAARAHVAATAAAATVPPHGRGVE